MRHTKVYTMKTARLFKTGRSKAVRIPKAWVEGVTEVEMERQGSNILIKPRRRNLWQVAEECGEFGGELKRLPQTKTGVRVEF
jgi:virulence-associated protein VagC